MMTSTASASGTFKIAGDLTVHRLGYGTMRLVGEGAWGEPNNPEEARRVLRRAVELGVTLIDTADAYGPEIAERLICEALYPYPPGLVIATKGGITRQGPAKTEYVGRAGYLIQCVEMSLRRLKLERIELYQLHRIDPRTPLEESLGAFEVSRTREKSATSASAKSHLKRSNKRRRSSPSSACKIATRSPTAATKRLSTGANNAASPSCPGIPWPAASCLSPTTPSRRRSPKSPPVTTPPPRRSPSPGSFIARPSCCPFPARPR